jgi:hypothetical protein
MTERNPPAIATAESAEQAGEASPEEIAKAKERATRKARMTVDGGMASIQIMYMFGAPMACEKLSVMELGLALNDMVDQVEKGSMAGVERLLLTQAVALNTMFAELSHRAAKNLGEHLGATDTYLRLAMKAQSQSANTLRILAEVKNPKAPVAFVKQANITSGNQQINNHGTAPTATSTHAHARTGEMPVATNELLEHEHGKWLDTGAASEAGGSNQTMAAVGEVHRAGD